MINELRNYPTVGRWGEAVLPVTRLDMHEFVPYVCSHLPLTKMASEALTGCVTDPRSHLICGGDGTPILLCDSSAYPLGILENCHNLVI